MAKRKSVKVVRISQALKMRGTSKKTKKNRATRRLQGSRAILNGSLPKTHMSVKSMSGDRILVSGLEVVSQVDCSQSVAHKSWVVNPSYGSLFPRLSALALGYERFRFASLRLQFYTAAPATRSGSIGLQIRTDPLSQVPADFVNLSNAEFSAVGSVAESMSTPTWVNKDPEQFFLRPSSRTSSSSVTAVNALKTFEASLGVLTSHSSVSDDNTIAGYVGIEYSCELINPIPAVQTLLQEVAGGYLAISDVKAPSLERSIVPIQPVADLTTGIEVGAFPIDRVDTTVGPTAAAAWASPSDRTSGIVENVDPGVYQVSLRQDLSAEAVYPTPPGPRPSLSDFNYVRVNHPGRSGQIEYYDQKRVGAPVSTTTYYNPDFIVDPCSDWQPFPPDLFVDCKTISEKKAKVSSLALTPLTTGDWNQDFWAFTPSNDTWVLIARVVQSAGAGAGTGWGAYIVAAFVEAVQIVFSGYPANDLIQRTATNNQINISKRAA